MQESAVRDTDFSRRGRPEMPRSRRPTRKAAAGGDAMAILRLRCRYEAPSAGLDDENEMGNGK